MFHEATGDRDVAAVERDVEGAIPPGVPLAGIDMRLEQKLDETGIRGLDRCQKRGTGGFDTALFKLPQGIPLGIPARGYRQQQKRCQGAVGGGTTRSHGPDVLSYRRAGDKFRRVAIQPADFASSFMYFPGFLLNFFRQGLQQNSKVWPS